MSTTATQKESKLHAPVMDLTGATNGKVELDSTFFGKTPNQKLLAHYVYVYQSNQRQGNASTKNRSEVTGSTRKIYRQKGTGGARHGSRKAPIFVGGGINGGPKPRDYSLSMNAAQKRLAFAQALSIKANDGLIVILDGDHSKMKPSTSAVRAFIKSLPKNDSVLMVFDKIEKNGLLLSLRNIPSVTFVSAHTMNAYEVLSHNSIVFAQDALTHMMNHFSK